MIRVRNHYLAHVLSGGGGHRRGPTLWLEVPGAVAVISMLTALALGVAD
jgi:hypothetical protein